MKDSELTYKKVSKNTEDSRKALSFTPSALSLKWSDAWKISSFRWKFWVGMAVFAGILTSLPFFFDAIENRNGYIFSDFILELIVTLLRMDCIGLISLNPPAGLIPLADPITNQFYGAHYITHDLFFSGHTTTVFLIFLCLKKKWDRIYALSASIFLGFFFLGLHVHYTIDVLAAPVFTYAAYRLALLFTKKENSLLVPGRSAI